MRNEYRDRIIRHLEKAGGWSGADNSQTFDDFLSIALVTLEAVPRHFASAKATGKLAEDTDEGKAVFQRIRDRYKPSSIEEFTKAFAALLDSASEWGDTIGNVYMEFGYPSTRSGQFFTPYPIAKMNAKMLASNVEREVHDRVKEAISQSIEAQALLFAGLVISDPDEAFSHYVTRVIPAASPHIKPITVNDPACGSGVMFIAFAEQCPRWALDLGLIQFYGMDIDQTCVDMARINCMLYGLNGYRMRHVLELSKYDLQAIPEPYQSKYQEVIEQPEKLPEVTQELRNYRQPALF
jgi:type I restriction-modification system DNA methylase subunit